jgi:hypothetical protein
MNKYLIAIFASVGLIFSCTGNNAKGNDGVVSADSVGAADTLAPDTMEQLIADTPMPKAADELFDDFIFNFAANRALQMKRVRFPLPVTFEHQPGHTDSISRAAWKTEHFFMRQGYYTLLFDNRKQMNRVKDTAVNQAVVEKINLLGNTIKQYLFSRVNGQWVLYRINIEPIAVNENASFLQFYKRFSADSAFQVRSLAETVKFVGPDPDDDFGQMEGILTPETWSAFAPEIPSKQLYNIVYGEPSSGGNQKIFLLRGIANGLEVEMTFARSGGNWKLVKLVT